MKKKRIVLIISILVCLALAGCTAASFKIYEKNLISVITFYYKTDVDASKRVLAFYLPESSIAYNAKGETVVYRLQKRMGWFEEEYYVEEIPLDFYYEDGEKVYRRDGHVRIVVHSLEEGDQLVKRPQEGMRDGQTVKWTAGQKGRIQTAVWD